MIDRIIIGSSNLTLSAITRNREWNTKIVSTRDGEIAKSILNEFDQLWNAAEKSCNARRNSRIR